MTARGRPSIVDSPAGDGRTAAGARRSTVGLSSAATGTGGIDAARSDGTGVTGSGRIAVGSRSTGGGDSLSGSVTTSRSEEHTSELQSLRHLVCRLLLEKKKIKRSSFIYFIYVPSVCIRKCV